MRIVRFYTGSDGASHIEEVDPDQVPDFQAPKNASRVTLMRMPQGRSMDYHPAPERR